MICAGIDAGSRIVKVVLANTSDKKVIASGFADQGIEQETLARKICERLLKENNLSWKNVKRVTATGYGRNLINFADAVITEITCHACGVRHLTPDALSIIEIGGQDNKFMRLNADGSVRDFAMNDRCAAGTGRFLEVAATRLGVKLQQLGKMAEESKNPAIISSMCVVFAETEIIGLLTTGVPLRDIAGGIQKSIAQRVASMAGRDITPPVVFTGGVAMVPGMASALQKVFGLKIKLSPQPMFTGALGAAIHAF